MTTAARRYIMPGECRAIPGAREPDTWGANEAGDVSFYLLGARPHALRQLIGGHPQAASPVAVARLGQEFLERVRAASALADISRPEGRAVWALQREVAELRSRVAALEKRDSDAAEAQREHEQAIYAEMREAGFDPTDLAADLDPHLSQEIWDEALEED